VIRDLGEPRRAADQLRDELDKLQTEHAELKARIAKLEATKDGDRSGAHEPRARPRPAKTKKQAKKG
jgi:cell division septum initiation protein DivIVA